MTICCIDYETSSLDFYNSNFQVKSLAMAIHDGTSDNFKYWYSTDLPSIEACLQKLAKLQLPVIAHNIAFEIAVTRTQFPGVELNWHADTARLTQLWDNGGLRDEEHFGLEACVGRTLPQKYWMHKEKAYEWIRNNITTTITKEYKKKPSVILQKPVKRGQEGKYINQLPADILEEYNRADVEVTLRLYLELVRRFESMDFDWTIDRDIWLPVVSLIVDSKIAGIKVDLPGVLNSLSIFQQNLIQLTNDFKAQFPEQIAAIGAQNKQHFNINSTKNLKELFVDALGIQPKILTKKNKKGTGGGSPSFSKKHLGQWGDAASVLVDRGSLQQVISASRRLIKLVGESDDKRWHCDLKTCGTRTGRFAGGGGLNIQGLSRRNELFMRNFVADEGYIFISQDLKSGEPTVTAHYSQDVNYRKLMLEMVGKAPYYENGILFIDSLYMAVGSVSPMYQEDWLKLWAQKWPAGSFAEQWLVDDGIIKSSIKKPYALLKALSLAIGYGQGAKGTQQTAFESGHDIPMSIVKAFWDTYWMLFPEVAAFAKVCEETVKKQGYILNEFGYRNVCEPRKAFNALIQSTVSSLIDIYTKEFFKACPWAKFVTIIHDEIIYQIPEGKIKETKEIADKVIEELNLALGWTTQIRLGFVVGDNFYACK